MCCSETAAAADRVVPATVRRAPALQVEVQGEHLRPYMRVSFNDVQGRTFLFNTAERGRADARSAAGKYDVVLYDYMQEVSRLPAAFTSNHSVPPRLRSTSAGF